MVKAKKKVREKKTREEKDRDAKIMRSASFFPILPERERRILEEAQKEYVRAVQYFIDKLWEALGLNDPNFKYANCRHFEFYPYSEFSIPFPESKYSIRLLTRAHTEAVKIVSKETLALRNVLQKIRACRYYNNRQGQANWQRILQDKRNNRTPPQFSPNSPIVTDTNTTQVNPEKYKDKDYNFTVDFGPIWNTALSAQRSKEHGLARNNHILIKFNDHQTNRELRQKGKLRAGLRVWPTRIDFVYQLPKVPLKGKTLIIGMDQGFIHNITAVYHDGTKFVIYQSGPNKHGKDTVSITKGLKHKKKGSKRRNRNAIELENYINFDLNRMAKVLDFDKVSAIYVEDLRKFGKGQNMGDFNNQFVPGKIREKLERLCHDYGVLLYWNPPRYRSRRCYGCGFTHGDNRAVQADFICVSCENTDNADVNAAKNNLPGLEPIHKRLPRKLVEQGFFWDENGVQPLDESVQAC